MLYSFILIAVGFVLGAFMQIKYPTVYTRVVAKGKEWWAKAKAYTVK